MKLYQHVYGRVSRGYRNSSSGYQLAALSDELADRRDLLDKLARYSFFTFHGGAGTEERYSFYNPVPGFLAFGCTRFARDRTGSIGWFAHHYICSEEEFIESSLSPVAILKQLEWFKNETELPRTRSLDEKKIEEPTGKEAQTAAFSPGEGPLKWRGLDLQLIDMHLGKPLPVIPMVVASDEDAWAILAELYSLLPRKEASRLSFSTLFTDATDFVDGFRLVFVPDGKCVPKGTYVYRVVEAGNSISPRPDPIPLSRFWTQHERLAPELIEFINSLRREPDGIERAAQLLPDLLATGQIFRQVMESLQVPNIYELILRHQQWITSYKEIGAGLDYDALLKPLWKKPDQYLAQLLRAESHSSLGERALRDLAARVANGRTDKNLIGDLEQSAGIQRFYSVVTQSLHRGSLSYGDVINLIEAIKTEPYYGYQLHKPIAHHTVNSVIKLDDRDWIKCSGWLLGERGAMESDDFIKAIAHLCKWLGEGRGASFFLRNYSVKSEEYLRLAEATWFRGLKFLDLAEVIAITSDPKRPDWFFYFLSRVFNRYDPDLQKAILHAIAYGMSPAVARNSYLLEVIRSTQDPSDMAKFFRKQIIKSNPKVDASLLRPLKRIEEANRRGFFDF